MFKQQHFLNGQFIAVSRPVIDNRVSDTEGRPPTGGPDESRAALTLSVLEEHDQPLRLADVADEVAVREADRSLDEITATDVLWVYDDLYFEHVPRLERAELVTYDQETDTVRLLDGEESASRA